eukprot:168293_1
MKIFLLTIILVSICNSINKPKCIGSELSSGWNCDYITPVSHRNGDFGFCDFDIIPFDFPIDEFNKKYLLKKPVLIDSQWSDWLQHNISFYFKSSLLKKWGSYEFDSGRSLELVLNAGVGKIKTTLNNYYNLEFSNKTKQDPHIESLYIFDRSLFQHYSKFIKYFQPPAYLNQIPSKELYGVLFIGPTETGATWHAHGETWQGSIFGRKRWFLYPPEYTPVGGFFPGYSAFDWYKIIYPELNENMPIDFELINSLKYPKQSYKIRNSLFKRGYDVYLNSNSSVNDIVMTDDINMNENKTYGGLYKPFECMVQEGQILYIPEFWWHSIVNVGDTIGIAVQSARYFTPWMQSVDKLQVYEEEKYNENKYSDLEREKIQYDIVNIHEILDEMAPHCAVHTFFMGDENMVLNDLELAEIYLRKTISMDPTFIGAYVSLYKLYVKLGKIDKGEKLLRIAYVLNRHHPEVRTELIGLFEQQGKYKLKILVEKYENLPVQ